MRADTAQVSECEWSYLGMEEVLFVRDNTIYAQAPASLSGVEALGTRAKRDIANRLDDVSGFLYSRNVADPTTARIRLALLRSSIGWRKRSKGRTVFDSRLARSGHTWFNLAL